MHNPEDGETTLNPEGQRLFSQELLVSLLLQLPRYQDFTVAGKTFEITPWPQPGWRPLDPGTGDEAHDIALDKGETRAVWIVKAGTTEGDFEVQWQAGSSNSIIT